MQIKIKLIKFKEVIKIKMKNILLKYFDNITKKKVYNKGRPLYKYMYMFP